MRLFIAEKPSLARAIAEVLPTPQYRSRTHIECGVNDVVAWCAGHILQTAPPESYGAQYKTWRLEELPIAPRDWKLEVSSPELLAGIQRLLKIATRVVHAGDPDREGQLLVDEVLAFAGYRGPVDRILIRDLSPEAVRKELGALSPNEKFRPLSDAALARQRADWLYGMNMTRLYTLLGRAAGYQGVLSVGRVQTPLLGLIVSRDRAIAEFRPAPYYLVAAEIRAVGERSLRAFWVPPEGAALDESGRLLQREIAESACERVLGQEGRVVHSAQDKMTQAPPLPYALADLQVDAGRRLSMSAKAVLDACQSLYETYRAITYPRSDCAYLPEAHHNKGGEVLAAIARVAPSLGPAISKADLTRRSKAWNDKKITAHHAIIPTPSGAVAAGAMTGAERAVYELVASRYLAQFYAPHEYLQTRLELEIAGERFVATGRQALSPGWKALSGELESDAEDAAADADADPERASAAPLPKLSPDERATVSSASILDKRTSPPRPFTDASLIAAMCAVAKYVTDPSIKKILTEADGIGTPATRAAIIETLFERGYVERQKKVVVSTPTGRALIASLLQVATTPDMTAVWEVAMRAIQDGRHSLDAFLARVGTELQELVDQGRALGRITVAEATSCPTPGRGGPKRPARGSRPVPSREKTPGARRRP
jgi:DNA topoisomerase-3